MRVAESRNIASWSPTRVLACTAQAAGWAWPPRWVGGRRLHWLLLESILRTETQSVDVEDAFGGRRVVLILITDIVVANPIRFEIHPLVGH